MLLVRGGGAKVRWCLENYSKCAAENIKLTGTVFQINCNDFCVLLVTLGRDLTSMSGGISNKYTVKC